jgi:tetratricopeptide (TPR) repeat protein
MNSQGAQVGDHNFQVNFLFGDSRPTGPVVAGSVPQAPRAFQPREDFMVQLRTAGPGVSVVRAVTGRRGVGKTQLAAAYARECIEAGWRLVAWVNAADSPAILNGLAVVADRLGAGRPGVALELVGSEVRNRLEGDGYRCLLVFDNVADPDEVRPYVPAAGQAQVVITSTATSAIDLGGSVPVDVFTAAESVDFLVERTGRDDVHGAGLLAEELGHLPMALAQAAAVIATQHLTYPVYLDRLRAYPLTRYMVPTKGDPYAHGVAEAISLSIDAVTNDDPTGLCGDLLDLISMLSQQGVSRDLLHLGLSAGVFTKRVAQGDAVHGPVAAETGLRDVEPTDAATVDEAVGRLANASLVTFGGDDTVIVHRMTMRVIRERAERVGGGFLLAVKAGMLLDAARAAQGEPRLNRTAVRLFEQHVVTLSRNAASSTAYRSSHNAYNKGLTERLLDLRAWALTFLIDAGDAITQAVSLGEQLLTECNRLLGEFHHSTMAVRNNLGQAYQAAGRPDEAISQYERLLAVRERLYASTDPETLVVRNNLGVTYNLVGRTAEAIELLERTVMDREQVLGTDHPETLKSRNNLASAYVGARRLSDAIREQERTLADRERALGDDHPDTFRSRVNLAFSFTAAGRLGDAIAMYNRAVADYERTLGDDHPEALIARSSLAACLYLAGKPAQAIAMYERVLPGLVRGFGATHPTTIQARTNLEWIRQWP